MRPFHGIVRGSFKVFDDLLRVNVEIQRSDSSRLLFSQLHHHRLFCLNINYYVLTICTNGGRRKFYSSGNSWLHKLGADTLGLQHSAAFLLWV
jgi:hypothetical protein